MKRKEDGKREREKSFHFRCNHFILLPLLSKLLFSLAGATKLCLVSKKRINIFPFGNSVSFFRGKDIARSEIMFEVSKINWTWVLTSSSR